MIVDHPDYPYDQFVIEMLRSGSGEVYRAGSSVCLGEVKCNWNDWTAPGIEGSWRYGDDAARAVIDRAVADGRLTLTKVGKE